MLRHWCPEQQNTKPLVKWKDLLSGLWRGPDPLLTSGRGYACIFPQDADSPIWIPDRLIRHVAAPQAPVPPIASTTKKEGTSSTSTPSANTGSPANLEQEVDPPTRQMSQLRIKVIVSPTPLCCGKSPECPTQATQQTSIPTWGQIKTLCHQAQGIASPQDSSTSPERMFIAMLALLSCQISASSPAPENCWAYFPDPHNFQVVT